MGTTSKRWGDFFIKRLQERGASRVLDVATGTGFHSVRLLKAGFLILYQRNYDAILGSAYRCKQAFCYCGDDIVVEPEHVDGGLARFAYQFQDGSTFHLNMFPLRRDYTRRLLKEAGFQRVETFGDLQEEYGELEPDFLVHVAEKSLA